jgi:peptidyl-dipeptidase Dcp
MLDMAYYTLTEPFDEDVIRFEKKAWKKSILRPQNLKVCMTTQFQHIMTGGYAAGYYSYKWAELLDADAFAYFKENGIFNRKTAQKFRDNILSKGATQDPNILYKNFRGKEPSIEAMLLRDGIINDTPKNEQA